MAESRRRRRRRRRSNRLQWRKRQDRNKALKTVLEYQTVRTAKNFKSIMTEEFKEMAI